MAQNYVNYQIEMLPENAEIIDNINALLLDGYKSKSPTDKPSTTSKPSAKDTSDDDTGALSLDDMKTAAKVAKKDHGEEFTIQVLKDAGVAVTSTLLGSIKKADEDLYADVITAWEAGPQKPDDDDGLGEDDDDGLGEDDAEVSAEAVKTALKAYAKSAGRPEAKAVMVDNGAKALSDVDDCSPEQLAAMMKAMV